MLDRNLIRQEPEAIRAAIARKGLDAPVDAFLAADEEWRAATHNLNELQADSNRLSKEIGMLFKEGKREEAEAAKAKTQELKGQIKAAEERERELEAKLHQILLDFPNPPHESCPDGKDENDNPVIREWGDEPQGETKPHWEIADELGLVEFERAVKVSGSGFVAYSGMGARMVRGLIQFMADLAAREHGYKEYWPPVLCLADSLVGTGNLPKFEDDLYKTTDGMYLAPTAEVPLTNLYRDEILDPDQVPLKICAYTPCFRREAGAAGVETRGIQRVHQFDKVELVRFERPDKSFEALEEMTIHAEEVLKRLGLRYRVIELCAGDIGAKGTKMYDLEVWAPGEERWLEVSSCGHFGEYQSRRANIRFRPEQGAKPEFVHILNGSGTALPRVIVALLESGYRGGEVIVPEALRPYLGVEKITPDHA